LQEVAAPSHSTNLFGVGTTGSGGSSYQAALLGSSPGRGAGGGGGSDGGGASRSYKRSNAPGGSLLSGLHLLESCFTGAPSGSRRLRDTAVHSGPVSAIVVRGGRAYSAGGRSKASASLLVWDAPSCQLLRTVTRRSTQWLKSPVTALCPVAWGRVGRGVVGGVDAHIVSGHANGQVRACPGFAVDGAICL
jgi:hypothetical protein